MRHILTAIRFCCPIKQALLVLGGPSYRPTVSFIVMLILKAERRPNSQMFNHRKFMRCEVERVNVWIHQHEIIAETVMTILQKMRESIDQMLILRLRLPLLVQFMAFFLTDGSFDWILFWNMLNHLFKHFRYKVVYCLGLIIMSFYTIYK